MDNKGNVFVSVLLALILCCAAVLSWQLIKTLREQQAISQQLAEMDNVKYGLFNANRWVEHIALILEKKINEFELNSENRVAIKRNMERMLDRLIIEVDRYMRKQNLSGKGWWNNTRGRLKQSFQDIFVNVNDIRSAVPEFADRILQEFEQPDARADLNQALKSMLSDLSQSTFQAIDLGLIEAIESEQECEEWNFCRSILETRLQTKDRYAKQLAAALLGLTLFLLILMRVESRRPAPSRFLSLSLVATMLMACGVLTPMIEVEARISELRFMLLQEPVIFSDQILYFQSKSVLDMVKVLTSTGAPDMIVVGVLIMSFSVLFPLAKLASSVGLLYGGPRVAGNGLIRFFALKSSKWSMADVMVVAIFMAYIGFNGIISSQLGSLANVTESVDVITTNGTSLEIGFFMFLAFCLTGLLSAAWLENSIHASGATISQASMSDDSNHIQSEQAEQAIT